MSLARVTKTNSYCIGEKLGTSSWVDPDIFERPTNFEEKNKKMKLKKKTWEVVATFNT